MIRKARLLTVLLAVAAGGCSALLGLKDPKPEDPKPEEEAPQPASSEGGSSDANEVQACNADLMKDPHHCGACNHDCLGGDCSSGKCQPVIVTKDLVYPSSMGIDKDFVYVTMGGRLVRIAKSDGGSTTLIDATPSTGPSALLVTEYEIYHSPPSGPIRQCTSRNCIASYTVSAVTQGVGNITTINGFGGSYPIAWVDQGSTSSYIAVPAPDAGMTPLATINAGLGARVRAFGTTLYWSENQGKRIGKLVQGSTTPVTYDLAPLAPKDFAVIDDEVVVATAQSVQRGRFGATTIENLVELLDVSDDQIEQIELDGAFVYVRSYRSLQRLDVRDPAAPAEVLVPMIGAMVTVRMVQDQRALYYVTRLDDDGPSEPTIWKVAK